MSITYVPKIDFAGVVTDGFDTSAVEIDSSKYTVDSRKQSLIDELITIISLYISDSINTDKNRLIQLSKVLYDANYKLLYKLSQDESFIEEFANKLKQTDVDISSDKANQGAPISHNDISEFKESIIKHVKDAVGKSREKIKRDINTQLQNFSKVFKSSSIDKTLPTNIDEKELTNTSTENEFSDVRSVAKFEPVTGMSNLNPVWLTGREAIYTSTKELAIQTSDETITIFATAFKQSNVQSAIKVLTNSVDKAINKLENNTKTAVAVGTAITTATAIRRVATVRRPSKSKSFNIFSHSSKLSFGASSAKVIFKHIGAGAMTFFKGLFNVAKLTIIGIYTVTKTVITSLVKLTTTILKGAFSVVKFTFITLPKATFTIIKNIGSFVKEKMLNNSIVKGIVAFFMSPAVIYIAGFIAGFITEKIRQSGGIGNLLKTFFTNIKTTIKKGLSAAIKVLWAGITSPVKFVRELKQTIITKIQTKLAGVDTPTTGDNTSVETPKSLLARTTAVLRLLGEKLPTWKEVKEIVIETRQEISARAKKDRGDGEKISIWIFLDSVCTGIENLSKVITTIIAGVKGIVTTLSTKINELITAITNPFNTQYETDIIKKMAELRKKQEYSKKSDDELRKLAIKDLANTLGFTEDKGYFSSEHNEFTETKFKNLFIADKLHIDISSKITEFKSKFIDKLANIMKIVNLAIGLSKSKFAGWLFGILDLLKDDTWLAGIPHPLYKIFAGLIMLAIRGIMAAFDKRKKQKFFLSDRFKADFGIELDDAEKKFKKRLDIVTGQSAEAYKNIDLQYLNKEGLINSTEIITEKDNSIKINNAAVYTRVNTFVQELVAEHHRLESLIKEFNEKGTLKKYLSDDAPNYFWPGFANSALKFPLIGLPNELKLDREGSVLTYNQKIMYMFNLKRGIIKQLIYKILGETVDKSPTDALKNGVIYSSDKFLKYIRDYIFTLPDNVATNRSSKKIYNSVAEFDDIFNLEHQKFTIFDPSIFMSSPLKADRSDAEFIAEQHAQHIINEDDGYKWNDLNSSIIAFDAKSLVKSTLSAAATGVKALSEEDQEKLDKFKSSIEGATHQDVIKMLSPSNSGAYVITSAGDVFKAILLQLNYSENEANDIIIKIKQNTLDRKDNLFLTKRLFSALVISNDTADEYYENAKNPGTVKKSSLKSFQY